MKARSGRKRGWLFAVFTVLAILPASRPRFAAEPPRYALRATLVTPSEVIESGLIRWSGGRIEAVERGYTGADVIDIDGVVFPGLIDLHNHLTWNVLPRWKPPRVLSNRYEWLDLPDYALALSGPHYALTGAGLGCAMNRYGEIKALVNGATATVGSLSNAAENACILGLVRNLDFASGLENPSAVNRERLRNFVFPFELNAGEENAVRKVDPTSPPYSDTLRAVVMHLAEGTDAASRREFRMFKQHGFIRKGVSVIHGIALNAAQLKELADGGVGFIWSPRSNLELYGKTADILSARLAGMTIAIAPDWSPTGSTGMLTELLLAWKLNVGALAGVFKDADLTLMATANPAKLAGLADHIGSLKIDAAADLLVMRRKSGSAHQALLRGGPGDVLLVVIAGYPLYGDENLMRRLLPGAQLETLTICGQPKVLNVSGGNPKDSWQETARLLQAELNGLGTKLAPLVECD